MNEENKTKNVSLSIITGDVYDFENVTNARYDHEIEMFIIEENGVTTMFPRESIATCRMTLVDIPEGSDEEENVVSICLPLNKILNSSKE